MQTTTFAILPLLLLACVAIPTAQGRQTPGHDDETKEAGTPAAPIDTARSEEPEAPAAEEPEERWTPEAPEDPVFSARSDQPETPAARGAPTYPGAPNAPPGTPPAYHPGDLSGLLF